MSYSDLSLQSIEKTIEDIQKFIESKRVSQKEKTRVCLMAEETLLKFRDKFGENIKIDYNTVERFSQISIRFTIYSEKLDPFSTTDDDGLMKSMLTNLESRNPVWKYIDNKSTWFFTVDNKNEIEFFVPKEKIISGPLKLVLSIVVAIILAFLARSFLSEEFNTTLANDFVIPISNAYTGILSVMAILMIFFSVPLCMAQYGNTSAFQVTTKRLISVFFVVTTIFVLFATAFCIIYFGIGNTAETGVSILKPIVDILISFIPTNIVTPFVNFNCMQVLIIGVMFGAAFNVMGKQGKELVTIFDKCNFVAVITNSFISKFVYIYVGLFTFSTFLSGKLSDFSKLYWFIIALIVFCILSFIIFTILVCVKTNVRARVFLKKLMPSFVINLSTASIGASFIDLFNDVAKKCGVDIGYNGVAINLGVVLFKPLFAVFLTFTGFYAAYVSGGISYGIIIEIIILSILLAITIPNIQCGATSVIVLMITHLGFGSKTAELLIPLSIIAQFIIVPLNVFCLQCLTVILAKKENKINLEKLRN